MADRKMLKEKGIRPKTSLGLPNRSAGERERSSGKRLVDKINKSDKTNPELWENVQGEDTSAKSKRSATIKYLKQGGGYNLKKKKKK